MTVVTIESLAAGGDGVARTPDGRVVFVPHTAVGDVVEIELTQEKKSFARGAVRTVREPGAGRREARCELFVRGACGGCQWLHVTEEAQGEAKSQLVASALRHVASADVIAPLQTPTPATGWRRRARLHWVRPPGSKAAIIGFTAPRSKRVTAPSGCVQVDPALASVFEVVSRVLATHLHKRGEIDIVLGADDRAAVALHGPHDRRGLEALAAEDRIVGVLGRGAPLGDPVVDFDDGLPVAADGFAQASVAGNRALIDVVNAAIGETPVPSALELYAGSGNLTRGLADRAGTVVGVERFTGPRIDRANIEWANADSAEAAQHFAESGRHFDLVLLDPPRSGAADCIDALCEIRADRIIYVSCDPATLARDVARLVEGGYELASVVPIDLMPQTSHVEVVVTLRIP